MSANHTTDFSCDKILPPSSLFLEGYLHPRQGFPGMAISLPQVNGQSWKGWGPFFITAGWVCAFHLPECPSLVLHRLPRALPPALPPAAAQAAALQWHLLKRHTSASRWSERHSCRISGQNLSDFPSGRALGASWFS